MDVHAFQRYSHTRVNAAKSSRASMPSASAVLSPPPRQHRAASTMRHSVSTGSSPRDRNGEESHAVYSPHPFRSISTPSQAQSPSQQQVTSPASMFSLFSRASTTFRPHDDQIIEVDEASGYNTHGRRYSSIMGSPNNASSPHKAPGGLASGRRGTLDSRRRSSLQYSIGGTPSRLSAKWDHKPWYKLGFGWRPRRSQLRRLCFWLAAIGLFFFCFSLVFVLPGDLQRLAPVVIGSLLSFISALTILVSFLLQPQNRRYPNELLVYVATCEFGLAVLALSHVMMYCSDTTYNCKALELRSCAITTALEMFLLLASVGWFGCAIVHLFVSVSNPFANYKSQLKRYHLTVWCGSILLSVAVPLVVFSESSQSRYEMSGVEICRAVGLNFPLLPAFTSDEDRETRISQWQTLNMEYWGTLFALVVLLVIAAQFILAMGWWRSNSGTVIALKARRRMMKRMTTYVHTLNATWLVLLVVFFTYRANPGALEHLAELSIAAASDPPTSIGVGINWLDAFFHFTLAAKGYFTCVVWLAVNKHCCAIGRPTLCKDPSRGASSSGDSYSSDDDDDSDRETNHLSRSLNSTASRARGGLVALSTINRQSNASTARPSSVTTPGFVAEASGSYGGSSSSSAVFASQNNETLQREIIYYTVCGITKSILKSSVNADADVFFQQLMVGADRESSLVNISQHVDLLNQSPRAYCHTGNDYCMSSTTGINTSIASSVGPSASFAASLQSTSLTMRDLATPSETREDTTETRGDSRLAHSFLSNVSGATSRVAPQRFSLYPVSQVPFELFEQEIELQSHRSSEGSLSLSPIFANLRRTAHALYNNQSKSATRTGSGTGNGVENPRPKMFIDYAPTEFRAIRRAFGLTDEMYLASFRSTAKERVSAGSSGAFMFFSGDNALIVKSMKEKECRKLVKMIPGYADYITSNPKSRIIRFFGCHRIRLYGRNFYFVVMSNVLHSTIHTPTITEKYDVKGSWIDRQAKLPQVGDMVTCSECNATYEFARADASTSFPFHVHRPDTILKDLDLKRPLLMGKRVARDLYDQLEMDCEFLNSMGIMDYSLLVGVHKCSHRNPDQPWRSEFQTSMSFLARGESREDDESDFGDSSCGTHLEPIPEDGDYPEEVYFVGIIDILQEWNWEKQLEKLGKTLIGKSSSGISAVAPDAYCQRFKDRVARVLRINEDYYYTKRLTKQLSVHPLGCSSEDFDRLEFQLRDSIQEEEDEGPVEQEVNINEPMDAIRDSSFDDEALQFEAEAIAVSIDLEEGRVSQQI